jgi:hypothetical protein
MKMTGLVDSKATPHPTGTFVQPSKLWRHILEGRETNVPGHVIMLDAPEWLAEQLLQAA